MSSVTALKPLVSPREKKSYRHPRNHREWESNYGEIWGFGHLGMKNDGYFQDDSTQNQKNSLQNGETPAKVEIKEENAENKSVAETAETSPPTENGKNEPGSAPDENGKENQVCKNSNFGHPKYN